MRSIIAALALGLTIPAAAHSSPLAPQLRLGEIRAQFFYSSTGTLSENILKPGEQYSGWNTCIDDGAPNDVLITVPLINPVRAGEDGGANSTLPVSMIARSGSKVIAQRTANNFLLSRQGIAYAALWLRDVTCLGGLVTVEVRMGNQRKTANMMFDGGE